MSNPVNPVKEVYLKDLNCYVLYKTLTIHFPDYHKDPFDRLLISQANQNNLLIVTKDNEIHKYQVETFWM